MKYLIFLSVLPILSIASVLTLNSSGNNVLTCITVFVVIAAIIAFSYKSSQLSRLYPLALFVIGASLLLGSSLANTSYRIHGYDMFGEYYVYQNTLNEGSWRLQQFPSSDPPSTGQLNTYSSCLSVTILPAIISIVTGYNGEMIFLLLYPIIASLTLPVIYQVLSKKIGAQTAFLSTLLMLTFSYVNEVPGLARQGIALFLFSVAIYLMFSEKGSKIVRYSLLLVISFGVLTSHYSTGYTYMLVVFVLAISSLLFGKTATHSKIQITGLYSLLIFCLGFSWYVFTIAPFSQMVSLFNHAIQHLQDIFTAPRDLAPIILSTRFPLGYRLIESAVSYSIQLFLLIGIVSYVLRSGKTNEGKSSVDKHIVFLAVSIFAFLALSTLLPIVSLGYGTQRLYYTLLPFLLFFFAEGASWFLKHLNMFSGRSLGLLMVIVVVLQILISTGLMSLFFRSPIPTISNLSEVVQAQGPFALAHFVSEEEVMTNLWFSQHYNKSEAVYADEYEILRLWSYGGVAQVNTLTGDEKQLNGQQGYVILRYENVVYNTIEGGIVSQNNTSQLSAFLSSANRVYDTNGTLIYQMMYP